MSGESKDERIRVAVLGGGAGALAAVWGLVNSPDADRYDVTVYQLGWRLGGKARSGRNPEVADRVEQFSESCVFPQFCYGRQPLLDLFLIAQRSVDPAP